jgi:hypothetical protein
MNKPPESMMFLREFQLERIGVEWYRVNLENGKTEKLNSPDVPNEWDDTRIPAPPYFIPFEHGQMLFGGIEKSYEELIGSVFVKSAQKTKPESPVKAADK